MRTKEIISQIQSLAAHCESMIDKEDPEGIWQSDVKALNEAVEILETECGGSDASETIKQIMDAENVSQTMLADKMGCTRQSICQMLNRGSISMRYDSFYKTISALGYEVVVRKK